MRDPSFFIHLTVKSLSIWLVCTLYTTATVWFTICPNHFIVTVFVIDLILIGGIVRKWPLIENTYFDLATYLFTNIDTSYIVSSLVLVLSMILVRTGDATNNITVNIIILGGLASSIGYWLVFFSPGHYIYMHSFVLLLVFETKSIGTWARFNSLKWFIWIQFVIN